MKRYGSLLLGVLVVALPLAARADIDVAASDTLDVLETSDGTVWKGVVIEQVPNVQYKIATADGSIHVIQAADVVRLTKQANHRAETASSLPAPLARTGIRADAELDFVFPTGTLGDIALTSFAPCVRFGYETMFGNIGLTGGVQTRFTYWRLQGMTEDAGWLLETHVYGRGAVHIGRAAPYLGITLGADTNYLYAADLDKSSTSVGFGMNLELGLTIAATPAVAIEIGGTYHPGTDTLSDATKKSAEYLAMRLGAQARF